MTDVNEAKEKSSGGSSNIALLGLDESDIVASDRLKCTLYIGGFSEDVNKDVLHDAFVSFGDIKIIEIPPDRRTGKHRGFGFIEYEEAEDAEHAVFNMNMSELRGRTLKVNLAKFNNKLHLQQRAPGTSPAAWADDFFYRKRLAEEGMRIADALVEPENEEEPDKSKHSAI